MNEVKPGYKTTEFAVAMIAKLMSFAVLIGVVPSMEAKTLEEALTKIVVAAGAMVSAAVVVWMYIKARLQAKGILSADAAPRPPEEPPLDPMLPRDPAAPSFLLIALLGTVAFWCTGSAVQAQQPPKTFRLLPWRQATEQNILNLHFQAPKAPQTDPALAEAMRSIAENQKLMLDMLRKEKAAPLPIAAAPKEIHHHHYLPVDPEPKQRIPIDPAPKDKPPVDPGPKHKLPIDITPKDKLPLDRGPKEKLPIMPLPKDDVIPRDAGPPVGYQRFTITPSHIRALPPIRFSDLPER